MNESMPTHSLLFRRIFSFDWHLFSCFRLMIIIDISMDIFILRHAARVRLHYLAFSRFTDNRFSLAPLMAHIWDTTTEAFNVSEAGHAGYRSSATSRRHWRANARCRLRLASYAHITGPRPFRFIIFTFWPTPQGLNYFRRRKSSHFAVLFSFDDASYAWQHFRSACRHFFQHKYFSHHRELSLLLFIFRDFDNLAGAALRRQLFRH